jgi:DNA-directed RNA polymerase subunit RPC12/RpoP
MIRFTCECGKLLQAREEQAGRAVACPACGRRLTVPGGSTAVQPGQPQRGPTPAATGVRQGRGAPAAEGEAGAAVTSGKAVVSLILGVLAFCTLLLTGLPAALFGFLALSDIKKGQGRVKGKGLAITGLVLGVVNTLLTCACVPLGILLWPAVQNVAEARDRIQSQNNLKQISLGMMNYHDQHQFFPPATLRASDQGIPGIFAPPQDLRGKPLFSWRVALLPYIEQGALYKEFRLNEPWDSEHNKKLLPRIPKTYLLPGETAGPDGLTKYQVFVGPQTMFEEGRRITIASVQDGTSNTLLVVEAAKGVPWTKPEDLRFDPKGPLPPLGGRFRKGFTAAFADGHTTLIPKDTPETTLKALITRNGAEIVPPF